MNIAIVGHGNVGRALATSLKRAGHDVLLAGRNPERSLAVATELGVRSATVAEAAASGDIVILAVPFATAGREVATQIAGFVDGKIVVDVTNAAKPDYSGPLFEGTSAAEQFAAWLPGAKVVKAFNTLFASNLDHPILEDVELDGFVAGDDASAKETILEIVNSMGLHGIDAGSLKAARYLEALAWLNISINMRGGEWRSAWKLVAAPKAA